MKSVESSTVRFSEGPLANISNSSGLLKEDGKRVRLSPAKGSVFGGQIEFANAVIGKVRVGMLQEQQLAV